MWSSDPAEWLGGPRETGAVGAWPMPNLEAVAAAPELAEPAPAAEDLAYDRGFAEGVALGRSEAQDELLSTLQALGGATQSLQAVQASLAAELEESLCALALAVAQRVVQREIEIDPMQLRELVRHAVDVLPVEPSLEIRLHPDDLANLDGHLDLYAAGGRKCDVQWVADATLERGGYVIETPQRIVDGRLDHTLAQIYHRLRDA